MTTTFLFKIPVEGDPPMVYLGAPTIMSLKLFKRMVMEEGESTMLFKNDLFELDDSISHSVKRLASLLSPDHEIGSVKTYAEYQYASLRTLRDFAAFLVESHRIPVLIENDGTQVNLILLQIEILNQAISWLDVVQKEHNPAEALLKECQS